MNRKPFLLHHFLLTAVVTAVAAATAGAETFYPKDDYVDKPNAYASEYATVGGQIRIFAGSYPKSFNYYLDNNVFSAELFGAMYETLLGRDQDSLEDVPALAQRWSISADKKTFTFWLNPNARWSDGQALTAADVKWTFDAIMNDANMTGVHKVALQSFASPEIIDEHTIRFHSNEVHWRNLSAVGGFHILPKHTFADADFNKINFEFPVVSGPYKLGTVSEGIFVTLERREDYWNISAVAQQNVGNFQTLNFRFFAERENAFEAFMRGQIDLYPVYTARIWMQNSSGERFSKNWIVKQKIFNHKPVGFQGFAMNMRRAPFNDVRVRKAMNMLLDRPKMNQQLMYSQYFLHSSYFEDLYSAEQPNPNPPVEFNKDAARQLFADAGWVVNRQTGLLEKNGRVFSFRFLSRSNVDDKFLAIYREDLRDVGIDMQIDRKDWAAWAKDMDDFNFEMTWASWSAGIFKDPEGMWASSEAHRQSGNNITGFEDARVDELINRQKTEFDVQLRHGMVREVDNLVYQQYPYVLLWNLNYVRLLYWNRFGVPDTVLSKYGDERAAYWYWWYDADANADLESAMASGEPLPERTEQVVFDQVVSGVAATPAPVATAPTADNRPDPDADAAAAQIKPQLPWRLLLATALLLLIVIALYRQVISTRKQ